MLQFCIPYVFPEKHHLKYKEFIKIKFLTSPEVVVW